MQKIGFAILLVLFSIGAGAQLKSPEQFLGYKVGEKFTPHWKIIEYYRHVAAAAPDRVKLQQYGVTYEGRPLMVAYVSTPANISNLDAVRTNNLRLAGLANDKARGNTQSPVIVWLSYNVHGNEASSSEASLLTLYALADGTNAQTGRWLQNTVAIIDPCLNPDGRDRYVNWFNSVVGKQYNASPLAREHQEPWPNGRYNHYNYDLNRDWAWQTQVESQQRLKLFHQWLPQIHVDFHEQGVESPYYFAPAAEPYHEVITRWQRDFQTTIGKNHARYFDAQGWLYFTKLRFDLLYPSYGDSYPIFNGSIGMTYEQAGHGRAGLGIQLENGDTLTLVQRATHHFTTSLSTLEVASQQASKLLEEFQKYYGDAASGNVGTYKSYVIRNNPQDAARVHSLVKLLDRNGIRYGTSRSATFRGYNYESGKEEGFSLGTADLVIPGNQPRGALVKVLFEPKSVLSDSLTYDITAWSLPYAYGLQAFATSQAIPLAGDYAAPVVSNPAADTYGYIIRWNGMPAVQLTGALLQKGIRLRYSETPFESAGQRFDRGSVIVLRTSNQYVAGLWDTVRAMATRYGVQLAPVATGFVDKGGDFGSDLVRNLKPRRVALLTGNGVSPTAAGEIWHYFEQELDYPLTLVNAENAGSLDWSAFDVMIMPNGNYRFLNDKTAAEAMRSWISRGGHLIAIENAVAQLAKQEWSIKSRKASEDDSKDTYAALRPYENRERDFIPQVTPGSIFRVELDNTHPLGFGFPRYFYTLKQDDAIYDFIKEGGWNVGVLKKDKQVAGFVGTRLQKRLQDGLVFGVQEVGGGKVTYLVDDVLFRSFWENGKLLFANAVFFVGQ
jgi:hypothetical protein